MENLENECKNIIEKTDSETINQFGDVIADLPKRFSSSNDSFSTNLENMKNSNFFNALLLILGNPVDIKIQQSILKLWDFLFQTSNCQKDYEILFSDNLTNVLLLYAFDLCCEDILRAYATVMKGISLKLKEFDNNLLIYKGEIPLLTHSLPFINFKDSITVSAMRFVVLNLCYAKDLNVQEALMDKTTYIPFESLVDSIDQDGFAFIADLLDVAPLNIRVFVLDKLKENLKKADFKLLGTALSMLVSTPAKSMLMEVLESLNPKLFLENSLSLGVFLFAIEKRLFSIDFAIKYGLYDDPLPSFSGKGAAIKCEFNIKEELRAVLAERRSPQQTALILEIYRKLYPEAQRDVYQQRRVTIDDLKNSGSYELMKYLVKTPIRQRTDIDSVLKQEEDEGLKLSRPVSFLLQLFEIEYYITKMNGMTLPSFSLPYIKKQELKNFMMSNQNEITVATNEIILIDKTMKLSSCYIQERTKKTVKIYNIEENKQRKGSIIKTYNEEIVEIEFDSSAVANEFEKTVETNQCNLFLLMLNELPE